MSTRNTVFAPLVEVPSSFLNAEQDWMLTQRSGDASNALPTGLNTAGTNHNARHGGVAYAHSNNLAAFNQIDNGFDYRDRQVRVVGAWDPVRDIRPGQAGDTAFPQEEYDETFYSAAGNFTVNLGASGNQLFINGAGTLQVAKSAGYLWLVVTAGTQVKART